MARVLLFGALTIVDGQNFDLSMGHAADSGSTAKAYFAGGCFWCMEEAFEKVDGVIETVSGYMGGTGSIPHMKRFFGWTDRPCRVRRSALRPCQGAPDTQLLEAFWRNVDPVTPNAQFCDHGSQYRAAIFYQSEDEKRLAEESKRAIEQSKRFSTPIVTQVTAASDFFQAEEYHQNFYKKNPIRYKYYKFTCGRAQRLELYGESHKYNEPG